MKTKHTVYSCDRCGKRLRTFENSLNIVTSLHEDRFWSRLHLRINHIHGLHNDATTEEAELCKGCAIYLLEDALIRVRKGERATAGTESIEEGKWQ